MLAMTRIAITAAAFDAIAATLPLYERKSGAKGDVHIWLEPARGILAMCCTYV
jgi:hypothetical protein